MKIDKVFIEKKEDINKIEYEKRTSVIRNPDGSTVFEMNDVIVPKIGRGCNRYYCTKIFQESRNSEISEKGK